LVGHVRVLLRVGDQVPPTIAGGTDPAGRAPDAVVLLGRCWEYVRIAVAVIERQGSGRRLDLVHVDGDVRTASEGDPSVRNSILAGAAAGALLIGAAGAALAQPTAAQAADPTPTPSAATTPSTAPTATPFTTTAPSGTATPGFSGAEHGPGLDTDDLAAASSALGMTEAALRTELEAGKTAAEVAAAKSIDVQAVIDAVVAYDTADIAAAVTAGTMTQAQADERLANLAQHVADEVDGVASGHGGGGHGGGHGMSSSDITDAAKVLGMTDAELMTELEAGRSVADVAEAKGVDLQKVIDSMVAADTVKIEAAVTAGTLTRAQADERLANLVEHVTDEVNATGLGHGFGRGHGPRDASGVDGQVPVASPGTGTGTGTSTGTGTGVGTGTSA
jgi:hypothetical protein